MRACAIDGRRGVGVHLENVHKLRAGNRQLTNLRNPDEMFRYRKMRIARTPDGTINILHAGSFSYLLCDEPFLL